MHDFNSLLTFFLSFILLLIIYWYYKIPKNLPPGPIGLPFVGSLPFIKKQPFLAFIDLAKNYGNVFHIYMGNTLVIILNDYETIKEAFTRQAEVFSGRLNDSHFKGYKYPNFGIVHNDGEYWRQHRRFLISNLRDNGVGKNSLEPRIMNEIQCFIKEIQKTSGRPVQIKKLLNLSLLNNVLLLANNKRYNYDDTKLANFVDSFDRYINMTKSVTIATFFPWTRKIPALESMTRMEERSREYNKVLETVKKFNTTSDNDEGNENTYVNAFLMERNRRLEQSEDEAIFTEAGLLHNTRDLLAAGGETTATLLSWVMLYLTRYPHVQQKAQEEIDRTIGRDREATYNDRFQTPYSEAILMETLRITSFLPLSLPHRSIRETTLFGYTIPANVLVFPNLYAVHHDPKLWVDPENFRPERFIGEDGQLLRPEYLIPFSLGKRACAGEPLARMESYLYLVTFLQNFHLVPTKAYQSLEAMKAIVRKPICDFICVKER